MRKCNKLTDMKSFRTEILDGNQIEEIKELTRKIRKDIVTMIFNAGSGHPGGSLSSVDIYTMLWLCANVDADMCENEGRDRIVISHGHTSAAVYSVLGNLGFCDLKTLLNSFRKDGSIFEGHPSLKVPGVEWCSGSLGQGLSVGSGFALAAKIKQQETHVFVVMGDGEQGKGQISEAREFASKYGLNKLTAIIDYNGLQASGSLQQIMPQNIAKKYEATGWKVISINGHDYSQIYKALRECYMKNDTPTLVLANTVMGKGVSFIENNFEYHGKVFTKQQYENAMEELRSVEDDLDSDNLHEIEDPKKILAQVKSIENEINYGTPIIYEVGQKVDCRSAFGDALVNIAESNQHNNEVYIAALDCDLSESVKLQKFGLKFPEKFIECGIQEHNAATVAAALSKSGILTFYADFGVFGIDETYGQHRMSDLNDTSLKLICTHNGLDVGEDGKSHQCIDYISNMSNLLGFKILIPADANQTDRIIRYVSTNPGNMLVAMGRSKLPILTTEDGEKYFDQDYVFEYGKANWIRRGSKCTIITCGTMVCKAVKASEKLATEGICAGILNVSCPGELDSEKISEAAATGFIVTYEDHNIRTGLGSIIGAYLAEQGIHCVFKRMGVTQYGVSASQDYQYKLQRLDEDSLTDLIRNAIANAK